MSHRIPSPGHDKSVFVIPSLILRIYVVQLLSTLESIANQPGSLEVIAPIKSIQALQCLKVIGTEKRDYLVCRHNGERKIAETEQRKNAEQ